jgi:hypothetical protein
MPEKRPEIVEGDSVPPYRIVVNGETEPGGYQTLEEAIEAVKRRHLGKRYQIAHWRQIVWPPVKPP